MKNFALHPTLVDGFLTRLARVFLGIVSRIRGFPDHVHLYSMTDKSRFGGPFLVEEGSSGSGVCTCACLSC
jgi:hypothetical protein